MAKVKGKLKSEKGIIQSPFKNYWNKTNYVLFFGGIFVLLLGFFLMSKGPWDNVLSLTYSPIVLLVAYIVIFPLSILYKKRNTSSDVSSKS